MYEKKIIDILGIFIQCNLISVATKTYQSKNIFKETSLNSLLHVISFVHSQQRSVLVHYKTHPTPFVRTLSLLHLNDTVFVIFTENLKVI